MPRIYICYRQEITNSIAIQLYHRLADTYGQENVFYQKKATGSTFSEVVDEIKRYKFFLVVLETGTLDNLDENSLFCKQVHRALESKRRIIPLLVDGFVLPKQLPANIQSLTEIIAEDLSSSQFQQTSEHIIQRISKPSKGFGGCLSASYWGGVQGIASILALILAIVALPAIYNTLFPSATPTSFPTPTTEVAAVPSSAATDTPETPQITNTLPPTITPEPPTATNTPDPLAIALDRARNFSGKNDDWKALYPNGFVQTFNGVEMVLVPKGCFMMGSSDGADDEQPVHEQCFDTPFWIDKTEVTNAQFGSVGCESYSSEPNQPRNCVTWFEARDFCASRDARLPTEREWEYAARGVSNWVYPWGNDFVPENAVFSENSSGKTALVGSRPGGAAWVGALDMSGNVWEWTGSWYAKYSYEMDDGREDAEDVSGNNNYTARVLRGGSFVDVANLLRAANRHWFVPDDALIVRGFRCVSLVN